MKLCLVSLNYNRGDAFPIGLVYLATYLKNNCKFNIDLTILDSNFDEPVFEKIIELKPDIIGMSSMTIDYQKAISLAEKINNQTKSSIPIIIGGVHISTLPTSLDKNFTLGIIGEGEETLLEILNLYEKEKSLKNENLKKIKGLVFHETNQVKITEKRELFDLNNLSVMDKSFINKNYFNSRIMHNGKKGVSAYIITSRGCPYNCVFCSTKIFWQKVRFHPAEKVVREIEDFYKNYNARHFDVWDDLFTINKERLKDIITLLKNKNILNNITFAVQARVNLIDDEICSLMKELNVIYVGFGFESGSDKMLKYLKNDESLSAEKNRKAAKLCKDYGFMVNGSLIFGSPNETIEDMQKSLELIDYFVKINVDNIWTFIMTPFPSTKMWEIAKERKKVDDYNMDWNLLSHQNIDNPLMLDDSINKEKFKEIFLEGRKKLKYFKWQKIKRDLRQGNIGLMIKNVLKNPKLLFNMVFKKEVVAER